MADKSKPKGFRALRLILLAVPFVAVLWPPLYNRTEPAWAGIPFFYWYQLLWIVLTTVLLMIVYGIDRRNGQV
ncbi:MAG TPA: DUF3311 domain-containing protein [Rhizomicrobium sp.]